MESVTYGADAVHEWVEFEDPANEGEFFRVNVSFLLSNYNCIYGAGCKSIKADMPREGVGCCSQGVSFFDEEDVENVTHQVTKLTDADCANLQWIKDNSTETNPAWAQSLKGVPYKTRKKDGKCIFANPVPSKPGDPPMGCSFHVMAERTGEHFVETKPWTCWVVPMYVDHGETTSGNPIMTITAASIGEWGGIEPASVVKDEATGLPTDYTDADEALKMDYLAWWCVDTPDAYNGDKAFYKSNDMELRKLMGSDAAYERLCELMEEYGERKFKMPGEKVNNGNPTIATISSLYQNLRERRDNERDTKAGAKATDEIGRPEEQSAITPDSNGVVSAAGSSVE